MSRRAKTRTKPVDQTSRRGFLKASAVVAGAAAAQALPSNAMAQGAGAANPDELTRLQGQRRILLRGGIVLTLDRQVGDFAKADVLIEDGKIREIRPEIAVSAMRPRWSTRRTASSFPASSIPTAIPTRACCGAACQAASSIPTTTATFRTTSRCTTSRRMCYAGVLVTALALIDMGTTTMVDISQSQPHARAQRRPDRGADRRPASARSAPIRAAPGPARNIRRTSCGCGKPTSTHRTNCSRSRMATSLDPKIFEYAREVGLRSVLHVRINSEPLLALGRAGLLRPGDEYIHCTHLNDDAWRLIKDSGGRTSHSPPLEMAMAHGMPVDPGRARPRHASAA